MEYYAAPLEGITGYIYRRTHHMFYPGLDRYYTPFLVPKEKKPLSSRERNDVQGEHNKGMHIIPQILSNKPDEFLRMAQVLYHDYGYEEINLNLGCPSKTVVSKKRGSGFLAVPDELDAFLDKTCTGMEAAGIKLSVKTRIGKESPEEFTHLLDIFAAYPLSELIVHPRVQKDFYRGRPDLDAFSKAYEKAGHVSWKLCYNGNITDTAGCKKIADDFPDLTAVMIGRGLLTNPMLIQEIRAREISMPGKEKCCRRFENDAGEKEERKRRHAFSCFLMEEYSSVLSGEKNILFKMKEIWSYMSQDFTNPQKYWKKMKKAQKLADFETAVTDLFREQELLQEGILYNFDLN
ncbi:MAG: tRNA-dihydrouridine synthase family protein [Eubacterium sp.]|jgi:tRNA-dihydrouridine synthase|nr:tRNA-dihydrouridine synthase family protein [Eubacterium sp.]